MVALELITKDSYLGALELPESIAEFTLDELYLLATALQGNQSKFELLLNVVKYRAEHSNIKLDADWLDRVSLDDVIIEMEPLVDQWLKTNDLVNNPIKKIAQFYGPDDDFNDLLVGEYEACEMYLSQYHETKEIHWLELMVKYLWRPLGEDGKRVSPEHYNAEMSLMRHVDTNILHIVYLWYIGCRSSLTSIFIHVFTPSNGDDEEGEDIVMPITRLIHGSAGDRNGTRSNIRWNTSLKEFLLDCDFQAEQAAKLDKK